METSPLLGGQTNPKRSLVYILLLTVIVGGLQISYSAEFANGSPYLISLGMSKALMSLVWIAGPISGTIGQPIVGILSDETRLKYGRRRPFIIGGAISTVLSLLMLSWSRDIVGLFTDHRVSSRTVPFAVFWVYVLDFSIQVIQAATRAFIVDNVPTHQQQIANAWAARMIGIGNIVAYGLGSFNLPQKFPFLGNTQFKALSAIACIALIVTVVPACIGIQEADPNQDAMAKQFENDESMSTKLYRMYRETVSAIKNLSPQTQLVCNIQFFAFIGYFPMLYYTTTFVGEIYVLQMLNSRPVDLPPLTPDERMALDEEGTRRGTQALFAYSLVSLALFFLLPNISEDDYPDPNSTPSNRLKIRGLTVKRIWLWSHILFIILAISTFWITTAEQATVFVGFLGVVWAVCQWAPFTIVAQEVSRIKDKKSRAANTCDRRFHKYEHQAGIVLGVLNVFVSVPQIVASLASSIIFKFSDTPDNGGYSVGWVFRFGGLAAIVAGYLTFFIKTPAQLDREDEFVE